MQPLFPLCVCMVVLFARFILYPYEMGRLQKLLSDKTAAKKAGLTLLTSGDFKPEERESS